MNTMKLILDDCMKMGGLEINLMHNNKSGELFIVVESDEGDLLIMEVEVYDKEE